MRCCHACSAPIDKRVRRIDSGCQGAARLVYGACACHAYGGECGDTCGELGGISLFLTLGEMLQCL